ncbi:MAG TPA: adenylate/guanylate cyclase domain-containing protein [Candidatus Tectomicrobia bacterium]
MQEGHSVEELMQLRAQIDQELNQRLTQTLCLMFADVVGSTCFFQKNGDVQGRLFIQRHHDILSPLVMAHGGRVVKTIGDAVMAAFEEPQRALDCALAMQHQLWETNKHQAQEEDTRLQTKISLHYGSALVEEHDIYGDLVNMSARLNAMAEPDQILVSHTVYDQVKTRKEPPFLPLETVGWKEGERGIPVYEVLWRQQTDTPDKPVVFRTFEGAYRACFYCGLPEHPVSRCPSKQLTGHRRRLEQLGYLPLRDILDLFRQEDLNTSTPLYAKGGQVCEAFYEISLPYQLRFLTKVWLASSEDWSTLERQQTVAAHSLIGTRLWKGFDCLRVGRYDEAKSFLRTAMESNPGDYKPHVVLGLLALETEESPIALQHWRKSLTLASTTLQSAYVHLLMHRLYVMNGKIEQAQQELQKALAKDPYLYEARYRQIALLVKADNEKKVLTQLQTLIRDDRRVYLQVMLDPAFAPLRDKIHALLSTLFQEARTEAIEQMNRVTEALNALREWYLHPEGELTAMEHSLDRMRQHIKSDSYFGYCDAVHEGTILQGKIQQLTGQRQAHLQRDFTATCATLQGQLTACAHSPLGRQPPMATQLAKYQQELTRLQSQSSCSVPRHFWQAWKVLQKLQTAVQELRPTPQRQAPTGSKEKWRLLSLSLFGVGGSILVDSALFAILGYLTYASGLRLPEGQILLFMAYGAFGGMLLGSTVGWLVHWYRSRP